MLVPENPNSLPDQPPNHELREEVVIEIFDQQPDQILSLIIGMLVINQINFGQDFVIPKVETLAAQKKVNDFIIGIQQQKNRAEIRYLTEALQQPGVCVVLLKKRDNGAMVGYSYAYPVSFMDKTRQDEAQETAYIGYTSLMPQYQNKGYIGRIMDQMESQLKKIGYSFLERHALTENGYAKKIAKHYGERIVKQEPYFSERYGQQMFFRIRL